MKDEFSVVEKMQAIFIVLFLFLLFVFSVMAISREYGRFKTCINGGHDTYVPEYSACQYIDEDGYLRFVPLEDVNGD